MNVRVTALTQSNNSIANIRLRSAELAKYQNQTSTGLRVSKPSDDPGAFPALSQVKAASLRLGAYAQNVSDSTAVLNAGVSTLQDVNDALVRAKQIALEGADATANSDPNSIEALAVEVDGLIDRALKSANSTPDGKTIFGGTASDTAPFSVATTDANGRPATIAYDGAAQRARTLTGPNQTIDTRYTGDTVFQKPGADVFQSLIALRDNLRNSALTGSARGAAFAQTITDLDASRNAIGETVAEQSSNLATLEAQAKLTDDVKLNADARIGELEGTDYAQAIVKMQENQTSLQAIYSVTSRLFESSLLDFIR